MYQNEKENLIFGLDIGTRSIIGMVGYQEKEKFIMIASKVIEHESRAMIDGQIHDILAVARGAKKVKEYLEGKIGHSLSKVSIAAAGRVLKTERVTVKQAFEEIQVIDGLMIKALEFQGISEAKAQIKKDQLNEEDDYFFVGHSVVSYYLNDYVIASLEEQKGKTIKADILATFLPKLVLDSLYTVMDKIGLKVNHLTLEPIAAMNTVIPSGLRMLNLALVDIGAGTSDIAITKEGTVRAYGMIPLAGDEITEKIVHTYLVDFKTAENIKQQLSYNETVAFSDIIGLPHEIPAKNVYEAIKEEIDQLGTNIASKIIELNRNQPPNAVFCVGGGSQTPHLTQILAEKLSMPYERVAIRSSEHAGAVIDETRQIEGPESITPLGICLTTMLEKNNDFISVNINHKEVNLLYTRNLTVADAAVAIGIDHTQIISVRGKTLMFKLNGKRQKIKGGVGRQPHILCNNKEVSLDTRITQGDELMIYPAQNGQDGQVSLGDLLQEAGLTAENSHILVNGKNASLTYQVKAGDDIIIKEKPQEVAKEQEDLMDVTVNDEAVSIPQRENMIFVNIFDYIDFDLSSPKGNIVLKLNGIEASYTDILQEGDYIEIYWDENTI